MFIREHVTNRFMTWLDLVGCCSLTLWLLCFHCVACGFVKGMVNLTSMGLSAANLHTVIRLSSFYCVWCYLINWKGFDCTLLNVTSWVCQDKTKQAMLPQWIHKTDNNGPQDKTLACTRTEWQSQQNAVVVTAARKSARNSRCVSDNASARIIARSKEVDAAACRSRRCAVVVPTRKTNEAATCFLASYAFVIILAIYPSI